MAKRMNRGRSSESSARSRRSRGGRFGTARSPRCRACGSGQGQEQTHSFLYPARDDGDDDHQRGFPRRRRSPEADGRARVPAYAHRPHDVCRPVGPPGPVSEPCPRFRVPITRAGEVPRRPAGGEPARRYARWRRFPSPGAGHRLMEIVSPRLADPRTVVGRQASSRPDHGPARPVWNRRQATELIPS